MTFPRHLWLAGLSFALAGIGATGLMWFGQPGRPASPPPVSFPARVSTQRQPMFSSAYHEALKGVLSLEPADVALLEERLKADPEDWTARLQLMAYAKRADRVGFPQSTLDRWQHFLFLLEHHPESEILASPYASFASTEFSRADGERVGQLWRLAIKLNPSDARIAWNAAQYYRSLSPGLHFAYVEKAVELAPQNEAHSRELGFLCARAVVSQEPPGATLALELLDSTGSAAVLEAAVWVFQGEYNKSLMLGQERKDLHLLAQRYFQRAQVLNPTLDKDWVLPQIRPGMIGMLAPGAHPAPDQELDWEAAARKIRRLPPDAFSQLPPAGSELLTERGCTIPQPEPDGQSVNVIRGEFYAKGEIGWAVLCSVGGSSAILVFRNDLDTGPEELAPMEDELRVEVLDDGRSGFSRQIRPVGRDYIIQHYRAYGGPEPPPIDHQGIDDAFLGKASVVYYRYLGKWMQLQGAD